MLEDIINKNAELKKHPSIISILKKIEYLIPLNVRDNFYRNLRTLKVELSSNKGEDYAYYEFKENELYICTDVDGYLLGDWEKDIKDKTKNKIIESTLCHEFMHMASTKYYSDSNLINSGFSSIIGDDKVLNNYLNEGFTEMFAEILYPESFLYSGYKDTTCIANIITSIVGLDKIKELYFSNSLAISLENYLKSFANEIDVKSIFYWVSNIFWGKIKKNKDDYNNSLKNVIFHGLIPVLDKAIINGINNGNFKNIEELIGYYNTYLKPNFDYLINNILLKNGYNEDLLNEYLEEVNFDINNYGKYFENNLKLGYISVYVLISILLIFIGIGVSFILI